MKPQFLSQAAKNHAREKFRTHAHYTAMMVEAMEHSIRRGLGVLTQKEGTYIFMTKNAAGLQEVDVDYGIAMAIKRRLALEKQHPTQEKSDNE